MSLVPLRRKSRASDELPTDECAQAFDVEILARAVGLPGDSAVRLDVGTWDVEPGAKKATEPHETLHLRWAGFAIVKVSHEADADAVLVVILIGRLAVCAVLLLGPSRADFHLPVGGIGPVADDEVISELVPTFGLVPLPEPLGAAHVGCAVMDDDTFPPVRRVDRRPGRVGRGGADAIVMLSLKAEPGGAYTDREYHEGDRVPAFDGSEVGVLPCGQSGLSDSVDEL